MHLWLPKRSHVTFFVQVSDLKGFPKIQITKVTFYLTSSRNNSYYTSIQSGSTDLIFIIDNNQDSASSILLSETASKPVSHNGLLIFEYASPITIQAGSGWELLDGDNNIYSAV